METAPRENAQYTVLPSLPLPGALAASGILAFLCVLGTRALWLACPMMLFCGVIFAALLLLHRTWISPVAAILSAVLGAVFAADTVSASVMLLFLPLGISIAFAVGRRMSRISATVFSAVATGLAMAVSLGIFCLVTHRTPGEWLTDAESACLAALLSLKVRTVDQGVMPVFTEDTARLLIRYLALLLPSAVPLAFFYAASAVTEMLHFLLVRLGAEADFFPHGWRIRVGRIPAVLYCAAQMAVLLAMTTPDAEGMYYAAYNASLVLMAPLLLSGLSGVRRRLREQNFGAMSYLALAVLAVMILSAGLYWLGTAAAMYGVFLAFRRDDTAT